MLRQETEIGNQKESDQPKRLWRIWSSDPVSGGMIEAVHEFKESEDSLKKQGEIKTLRRELFG